MVYPYYNSFLVFPNVFHFLFFIHLTGDGCMHRLVNVLNGTEVGVSKGEF